MFSRMAPGDALKHPPNRIKDIVFILMKNTPPPPSFIIILNKVFRIAVYAPIPASQ